MLRWMSGSHGEEWNHMLGILEANHKKIVSVTASTNTAYNNLTKLHAQARVLLNDPDNPETLIQLKSLYERWLALTSQYVRNHSEFLAEKKRYIESLQHGANVRESAYAAARSRTITRIITVVISVIILVFVVGSQSSGSSDRNASNIVKIVLFAIALGIGSLRLSASRELDDDKWMRLDFERERLSKVAWYGQTHDFLLSADKTLRENAESVLAKAAQSADEPE